MAVHLRLRRMGSKKRPVYGVVAADHRFPRDGRYIEKIGNYYPLLEKTNEKRLVVDTERAKYWLSQGAQMTHRVALLFAARNITKAPVRTKSTKKHLPKAKAMQRAEEKAAAAKSQS